MPHEDLQPLAPISPRSLTPVNESTDGIVEQFREACRAWVAKSPSLDTRSNYQCDLDQFMAFVDIPPEQPEQLASIRPRQVAEWRDHLHQLSLANSSIRRKLTVLRSLFAYLQSYGYTGANPAHSDFVEAPPVPRDGKTVALTAEDCRRLLDYPKADTPLGVRDQALLAVLAYTACRVGELIRLKVGSYKTTSGHRILEIYGKGGKERRVPLHAEAVERLERWLDVANIREDLCGPLFRPLLTARGEGKCGFAMRPLTRRAVQYLVDRYVAKLRLDPNVTVHSFRVTALTTARERGSDVIDLQDFAGHSDPRTTLMYIRNRDRLAKSPAYILRY